MAALAMISRQPASCDFQVDQSDQAFDMPEVTLLESSSRSIAQRVGLSDVVSILPRENLRVPGA